ncbi:MAG TPA: glycosyl hydrolase family 65 protein [Steroidobacteraceae bacterium]|jgi:trehalose/maltose hydrolase-like predicted phosphorylase|nr:glycosyl hydrolase family 65 protein [Steroidobacteraceae bacterium]
MTARIANARRALWPVLLLLAAGAAAAETDPSFLLRAGAADLPSYFPAYLANGYFSTLSTPRGTDATRSYMAGLMDYTAGDMSRPASIPAWTEIDFNPGTAGHDWLNRVTMSERRFRDYHQTLDLHDATLTSSYRYADHGRDTAVEVTTLVSAASPHLAASRFKITPDYDGVVQLSFALTLWAEHVPRFPLAHMSGPEMEEAVAAYGLSLKPLPPSTPDREAIWYPGYVQVHTSEGDSKALTLWLDGQAEQGQSMAMAVAVALPEGVQPDSVTLHRDRFRLALDVNIKVERGHSYSFTKYVAVSRDGWGGRASDDLALAREARERGFERLLSEQRAAWEALWQSDILIDGDPRAQQAVHSELYYLLASTAPGSSWGLGPCGLTTCYTGHAFWDSDTWMFPALLLMNPARARSFVDFRERTLEAARQRAHQHGLDGAMYPWESDPENGSDQTPHSAVVLSDTEIHVNADVAIAQWQYYEASRDRDWLKAHGWPVLREVAKFWASRATWNAEARRYDIAHLTSVAESYNDIVNDTFTNLSAVRALRSALAAARVVGERPDPLWEKVASRLYIPMAPGGQHHLAFDPSVALHAGSDFGGGPLSLLFLPSLDLEMQAELRRGDYDYAIRPTSVARASGGSMNLVARVTAAAEVGSGADAAAWFAGNFTGGTLKPPFNVRTESADNNVGYFLTGSGGYIQSLLYGFTGLRIRDPGLVAAYPPVLPESWKSLTLRNLTFRGQRLDIHLTRDAGGAVRLTREVHK